MTAAPQPYIDCHTHIGRLPGVVGDLYTADDLAYIMEHQGPEMMLASSASATTVSQRLATDETIDMVTRYGDRLRGLLWINPQDPEWAADLPRADAHGFCGIKIHPVLDHYAVSAEPLRGIWECAAARGWPILTHTGPDDSPSSAFRYEPLLRDYASVPLILAHTPLEAILVAQRMPNAYLDTTHVPAERVALAVEAVGADRILFGTHFPLFNPLANVDKLRLADIPEEARTAIASENARRILGIE